MVIYQFKKDPFSSHRYIADFILEEKCQKVLDVGCNEGQLLKALADWQGEIWGIDKKEELLKVLKDKYSRVFKIDVGRENFDFIEKFDALIFGDILEHIERPEEIIKKFLKNLKPNSIIIISVPNVANWFIRLQLLLGNFNYTERGILDKTHLRFFTLKSIKRLINNCGLKIVQLKVTPIPLPLIIKSTDRGKPLFFLHLLNNLITKFRPSFFGYQFVLKCKLK